MTDPMITTDALAALIGAPDLKIVDASWHMDGRDGRALYQQAHIPGALFFDIDGISDKSSPLPHMLATPEAFAAAVGALGISERDDIVVYDQAGLFSAARAWWNFRIMGAERVRVLDGGLPKWIAEGRPVETGVAKPEPVAFRATMRPALLKDFDAVKRNIEAPAFQLLDARSAARFRAEAPEPRAGLRGGHVPGSVSLPFGTVLNADGTMKDAAALAQVFDTAGVDQSCPLAASCGSGVTAPIVALALARLGREDVAIYDGSWTEWGGREDAPVATGA
ncbi:MAG: 3-mercaptopyruvate sulfurtransferase [Proteobacteria bacterium]|nr:3-mercaptopyruvate sulfurtransferase [Pseudomonadota bacterium]